MFINQLSVEFGAQGESYSAHALGVNSKGKLTITLYSKTNGFHSSQSTGVKVTTVFTTVIPRRGPQGVATQLLLNSHTDMVCNKVQLYTNGRLPRSPNTAYFLLSMIFYLVLTTNIAKQKSIIETLGMNLLLKALGATILFILLSMSTVCVQWLKDPNWSNNYELRKKIKNI